MPGATGSAEKASIWSWGAELATRTIWNCGAGSGIPCHRLQKVEILRCCAVPCTCRMPSRSPLAVTGSKLETPTKRVSADWHRTLRRSIIPCIRHIVRRTREYLETTIDETGRPYLKPVRVELWRGARRDISLPPYLQDAYTPAEEFCHCWPRIKARLFENPAVAAGGSTMYAGRKTAEPCSAPGSRLPTPRTRKTGRRTIHVPYETERTTLQAFIDTLEANQERDPGCAVVLDMLLGRHWLDQGCIIFLSILIRFGG